MRGTIGAIAAPIIIVAAIFVSTYPETSPGGTSYVGVTLGYLSGLLASRYDLGFVSENNEDCP